jgi:hypothetical protein
MVHWSQVLVHSGPHVALFIFCPYLIGIFLISSIQYMPELIDAQESNEIAGNSISLEHSAVHWQFNTNYVICRNVENFKI